MSVQAIATFTAAFIVAFVAQWKLTLITASIAPVLFIVTFVCAAIDSIQETRILQIYSRAGTLADEIFSTVKTVHAFWAHPRLSKKFDAILQVAETEGMKKSLNLAILYSAEFFCVYAGYALCFWQGIRMYSWGEIENPGVIIT